MRGHRIIFVYFDGCEVLDFAGPLQAFSEANSFGAGYRIEHCAAAPQATTSQGLAIAALGPLPAVTTDCLIIVPGFTVQNVRLPHALVRWLKKSYGRGATIASVCTGAFLVAAAGLADDKRVATHWQAVDLLASSYREARVDRDAIFVRD